MQEATDSSEEKKSVLRQVVKETSEKVEKSLTFVAKDVAPRRKNAPSYKLTVGDQIRMKPSGQLELVKGYGRGVFYAVSKRPKYVCPTCGSGLVSKESPCFACIEKYADTYEQKKLQCLPAFSSDD